MNTKNFTAQFQVGISSQEATQAINDVKGWWAQNVEGETDQQGDRFKVIFGETFVDFEISKMQAGQLVEWLVTDCDLQFQEDVKEWMGTRVRFELEDLNPGTEVTFTHVGLVPEVACYEMCSAGWSKHFGATLFRRMQEGLRMEEQHS